MARRGPADQQLSYTPSREKPGRTLPERRLYQKKNRYYCSKQRSPTRSSEWTSQRPTRSQSSQRVSRTTLGWSCYWHCSPPHFEIPIGSTKQSLTQAKGPLHRCRRKSVGYSLSPQIVSERCVSLTVGSLGGGLPEQKRQRDCNSTIVVELTPSRHLIQTLASVGVARVRQQVAHASPGHSRPSIARSLHSQ